jgi:hypothetical protein
MADRLAAPVALAVTRLLRMTDPRVPTHRLATAERAEPEAVPVSLD